MVYHTISPDMKQRALYLLLEEEWEMIGFQLHWVYTQRALKGGRITMNVMVVSTLLPCEVIIDC